MFDISGESIGFAPTPKKSGSTVPDVFGEVRQGLQTVGTYLRDKLGQEIAPKTTFSPATYSKAVATPTSAQQYNASSTSDLYKATYPFGAPYTTEKLGTNFESNKAVLLRSAAQAFPGDTSMQRLAVTQAIHESRLIGSDPSDLAMRANNLFGIKGSYQGQSLTLRTREVNKKGKT